MSRFLSSSPDFNGIFAFTPKLTVRTAQTSSCVGIQRGPNDFSLLERIYFVTLCSSKIYFRKDGGRVSDRWKESTDVRDQRRNKMLFEES